MHLLPYITLGMGSPMSCASLRLELRPKWIIVTILSLAPKKCNFIKNLPPIETIKKIMFHPCRVRTCLFYTSSHGYTPQEEVWGTSKQLKTDPLSISFLAVNPANQHFQILLRFAIQLKSEKSLPILPPHLKQGLVLCKKQSILPQPISFNHVLTSYSA